MEMFVSWPWLALLALAVPSTLALAGVAFPRRAGLASGLALVLALLFTVGTVATGGAAGAVRELGVRVDVATCVVLLLVAALGAIIVRFSRAYLDGDRGFDRYRRWLLLTLAAITALVVANNLLVMAVAWTAASLSLHQLLTFYADRPAALVAAHKKFLISRLADGVLAVSLWLVYQNVGSLDLDHLATWVSARSELPLAMEVAAVLLVLAVALRSAQLPFHGWIIQVMEAPTPVSALLHAGVVNVGGFVLIRVAPWIAETAVAQLLLVCIGLATATLAALIMTTRVSVKVSLAWSTCAQMGFMLVQCGLGLWPLALLHLVAHSLYKAHAFLGAGATVDEWRVHALNAPRPPVSPLQLSAAVLVAAGLAFAAALFLPSALGLPPAHGPAALVAALLLGLSLVPLVTARPRHGGRAFAAGALRIIGIVLLYLGWHAAAQQLFPATQISSSAVAWWLTGGAFLGLFVLKSALQLRPGGALARTLHPWLFSGLYLNELFTRLTFRVWPLRLPPAADEAPGALPAPAPLEVQS